MIPRLAVLSPRVLAALLLLGFASGLPFNLVGGTLKVWAASAGLDLVAIGFLSALSLPYSLKILWAPVVDRFAPPLGRRRGWLIGTQLLLTIAIAAMAFGDPADGLGWIAGCAMAVAFLSATQDVAGDAWRCDVLDERSRGAGAALWVTTYRLALLAAGGLSLVIAEHWGWRAAYLVLAGGMVLGACGSLLAPEPSAAAPPATLDQAAIQPFREFLTRLGPGCLDVLAFVVLYKLGDAILASQSDVFLVQAGYTKTAIGGIKTGVGMAATIAGGLLGGVIFVRLRTIPSLWVFGIFQAASNLAYAWLAWHGGHQTGDLAVVVVIENFCGGLGTAAFIAFLMGMCNPAFSATQYALLTALMAAGRDGLASFSGYPAAWFGWPGFFLFSAAVALPGLALLPLVGKGWREAGRGPDGDTQGTSASLP